MPQMRGPYVLAAPLNAAIGNSQHPNLPKHHREDDVAAQGPHQQAVPVLRRASTGGPPGRQRAATEDPWTVEERARMTAMTGQSANAGPAMSAVLPRTATAPVSAVVPAQGTLPRVRRSGCVVVRT
jgi:hypothetical protein